MKLLVGLGNPGEKYARTRHNIGFLAVEHIGERFAFSPWKAQFQGLLSTGRIGEHKIVILKPQTFMNESGRSVGEVARYFKISPDDIFVFHDELDLPSGKVRVKMGGGSGGHNGIKSIDSHLGKDYHRVRLGIGHPGTKEQVVGYVLADFPKSDDAWLGSLMNSLAENVSSLIEGNSAEFLNSISNRREAKLPEAPASSPERSPTQATSSATHSKVGLGPMGRALEAAFRSQKKDK